MKLLVRTSLYYILFNVPVLLLAGAVSYFAMVEEVRESNDKLLRKKLEEVRNYIEKKDSLALQVIRNAEDITIQQIQNPTKAVYQFSDTAIENARRKEPDNFRVLNAVIVIRGTPYRIRILRSTVEFEELVSGISEGLLVILIISSALFFGINYFISKWIWRPFYKTLTGLQNFEVGNNTPPEFPTSQISEFSDLNSSLNAMTRKLLADFKNQKQFAENASHEMQTPLAIMQAKIDLLFQSGKIGDEEMQLLTSLDDSIKRLARLNVSLLFLSKIENKQFKVQEEVSLNKIILQSQQYYGEYFNLKRLDVHLELLAKVNIRMNEELLTVLWNNLLQNAIRHIGEDGHIRIRLKEHELAISNTASGPPLDSSKIFERFQKDSSNRESLGLGLAIASEIAQANNLKLGYSYGNNMHIFSLRF